MLQLIAVKSTTIDGFQRLPSPGFHLNTRYQQHCNFLIGILRHDSICSLKLKNLVFIVLGLGVQSKRLGPQSIKLFEMLPIFDSRDAAPFGSKNLANRVNLGVGGDAPPRGIEVWKCASVELGAPMAHVTV
jgi:hypothetical protein